MVLTRRRRRELNVPLTEPMDMYAKRVRRNPDRVAPTSSEFINVVSLLKPTWNDAMYESYDNAKCGNGVGMVFDPLPQMDVAPTSSEFINVVSLLKPTLNDAMYESYDNTKCGNGVGMVFDPLPQMDVVQEQSVAQDQPVETPTSTHNQDIHMSMPQDEIPKPSPVPQPKSAVVISPVTGRPTVSTDFIRWGILPWIYELNPFEMTVEDAQTILHYYGSGPGTLRGMARVRKEYVMWAKLFHNDKADCYDVSGVPKEIRLHMWYIYDAAYRLLLKMHEEGIVE